MQEKISGAGSVLEERYFGPRIFFYSKKISCPQSAPEEQYFGEYFFILQYFQKKSSIFRETPEKLFW